MFTKQYIFNLVRLFNYSNLVGQIMDKEEKLINNAENVGSNNSSAAEPTHTNVTSAKTKVSNTTETTNTNTSKAGTDNSTNTEPGNKSGGEEDILTFGDDELTNTIVETAETTKFDHYIAQFIEQMDSDLLVMTLLGNPIWKWAILIALIFLIPVVSKLLKLTVNGISYILPFSRKGLNKIFAESMDTQICWLIALGIAYFFSSSLRFTPEIHQKITLAAKIFFFVQVYNASYRLASNTSSFFETIKGGRRRYNIQSDVYPLITSLNKLLVVIAIPLFALQNLGVNVVSLLTGVGLGGLAFALAAKDTAANFFGSLVIFMDRPFKTGDWVVINERSGIVTEIGFRSTRIRTFYGSLITIPNADMANSVIDNMGMRRYRRIDMTLSVEYGTPTEKIEAFIQAILQILKSNKKVIDDDCLVNFLNFGAASLDIRLYFFADVHELGTEWTLRQNINLDIIRAAKDIGIGFAFPTQTLHIETFHKNPDVTDERSVEELQAIADSYGSKALPNGLGVCKPIFKPMHTDNDAA